MVGRIIDVGERLAIAAIGLRCRVICAACRILIAGIDIVLRILR